MWQFYSLIPWISCHCHSRPVFLSHYTLLFMTKANKRRFAFLFLFNVDLTPDMQTPLFLYDLNFSFQFQEMAAMFNQTFIHFLFHDMCTKHHRDYRNSESFKKDNYRLSFGTRPSEIIPLQQTTFPNISRDMPRSEECLVGRYITVWKQAIKAIKSCGRHCKSKMF